MEFLDLFSGIGGFTIGLEKAGMRCIAHCEIEPYAQKILKKHWPDVPLAPDIRKLSYNRDTQELIYDQEVIYHGPIRSICGGFPCQPWSVAGKQRGEDDDRHLWPEYLRLIREIRPRWVIGENVAGLINLGLDAVLADLEGEGYTTESFVIPAVALNAKHRRDRVWIVAHADSEGEPDVTLDDGQGQWQLGQADADTNGRLSERERQTVFPGWDTPDDGSEGSSVGDTEHNGSPAPAVTRGAGETGDNNPERKNKASEPSGTGGRGGLQDVANADVEGLEGMPHGRGTDGVGQERNQRTARRSDDGRGKNVADHDSERSQEHESRNQPPAESRQASPDEHRVSGGGTAADTLRRRQQGPRSPGNASGAAQAGQGQAAESRNGSRSAEEIRRFESRLGGMADGLSIWAYEPAIPRVAAGIPDRTSRLKCLGNAVVPQIPEAIGHCIMAIEECRS